jgi:hypothetical protein
MTRIILAYKNMAAMTAISHIGLGVAALNTCKVLQSNGYRVEVWAVDTTAQLIQRIAGAQAESVPITHFVMSAPWIPALDWQRLCIMFHRIQFTCSSHSNVGFLQADPRAAKFMTVDGPALEVGFPNFTLAANSQALCAFLKAGYAAACQYLPNLYFLNGLTRAGRPLWTSGDLRIGCFGAARVQKNHVSASAAAIEIASRLRAQLEFWVSGGRNDGMGGSAATVVKQIITSCKFASYHEVPWEQWPIFRRTIANMHLLMQPSYTESFNIVTADGVAEGVPSVVSSAIDWVPDHWQADADDVADIARVGSALLKNADAAQEGLESLTSYVTTGAAIWAKWITSTAQPTGS